MCNCVRDNFTGNTNWSSPHDIGSDWSEDVGGDATADVFGEAYSFLPLHSDPGSSSLHIFHTPPLAQDTQEIQPETTVGEYGRGQRQHRSSGRRKPRTRPARHE